MEVRTGCAVYPISRRRSPARVY